MKQEALRKLVEEAVLKTLNESPAWDEIERKLGKLFTLSPGLVGNVKSLTVEPDTGGIYKAIVFHDKRGNKSVLLKGASEEFIKRYLPPLANLISALSSQTIKSQSDQIITFS